MSNKEQSKLVPKSPATFKTPKNQTPAHHKKSAFFDSVTNAKCVAFDHALGKSKPNK